MLTILANQYFSPFLTDLQQTEDRWAGIPWYVWLIIFLVIVLFLWWRLSRSAAQFDEEAEEMTPHDEEHEHDTEPDQDEAEEAEPEAPPVVEPALEEVVPDDLTKVEGIGPKISGLLQEAGISTYAQLAGTSTDRLDEIVDAAGLRMANVTTWPEQAKLAADGKWDDLAQWQGELKGGRHRE